MRVEDFDFRLPTERIAQRPVEPRDAARLLRVTADGVADRHIRDLPGLLGPGDLLVFNDTRVVPARLAGLRGAVRVSVTLHQALGLDCWRVFAKPGKRLHPGDRLEFAPGFSAAVIAKPPDGFVTLRFDRGGPELLAALHRWGRMPLPPYIRGGIADERDAGDYQTLFARNEGAVAAPTAALHFTPALIAALEARGIDRVGLTLHVGAGTFLPVKVTDTADHVMYEEIGFLPAATAAAVNRRRAAGGRIVAIGTTSLRLLESAASSDGTIEPFSGPTALFITPGYRFKVVDMLLTNFHLPRSTLFMLVAGFSGLARIKAAYDHAVAGQYRFYSYGDCCLLDRVAGA
jgi:S-adenosylmethionine:tRNA ribosyltransferase-isomerase